MFVAASQTYQRIGASRNQGLVIISYERRASGDLHSEPTGDNFVSPRVTMFNSYVLNIRIIRQVKVTVS